MDTKQLLVLGCSVLTSSFGAAASAQRPRDPYVRVAEIKIDPEQLEPYREAVKEQIEAAVRLEPGVLALYCVADKENPSRFFVLEMYADTQAYQAQLISENTRRPHSPW